MRIIVPIKQVPETKSVKMDEKTGTVIRDGVESIINPLDLYAIELAIQIKEKPRYVSRGGIKLEKALHACGLENLDGKVCVDVGSSTGGFTDCLLQHGARLVYAVDVGYGQLHYSLRNDRRIKVMERTNVRKITGFPEPISLVTIDASFISLKIILPVVKNWPFKQELQIIALIKPQFEVGREIAARGKGVIVNEEDRKNVIDGIISFSRQKGFLFQNLIESPLVGPKGNTEFLVYLIYK